MTRFSFRKLSLPLLSFAILSLAACGDDDDILGIDTDDNGTVFLSSNTTGMIGILDVEDDPLEIRSFMVNGTDADGIYYNGDNNNIFQVNRSSNTLIEYDNVFNALDDNGDLDVNSESDVAFDNGRGLAYYADNFVVANDGDSTNSFVVFRMPGEDVIESIGSYPTTINVWGVEFVGTSLYAVVDNSDSIAIYDNFLANTPGDTVAPTRFIKIDGITRTHGLTYDEGDDLMILTDIGDAGSDSDGGIVVIRNFSALTSPTTIGSAGYTRISGPTTKLGNPVDVGYDTTRDMIYVAERANGGGTLLGFPVDATGDTAPMVDLPFAGASSVDVYRD